MLPIQQTIIPISPARTGDKRRRFLGIVIHNTDNFAVGAGAKRHSIYMTQNGGCRNEVSYHYVVDDREIYQIIPEDEHAWHASCGRMPGNLDTIAIEICVNPDSNFDVAFDNACELSANILKRQGVTNARAYLYQHYDFASDKKPCPSVIRRTGRWEEFIRTTQYFLDGTTSKPETPKPTQPSGGSIGVGTVVKINKSATKYSTGQTIPQSIKERTHTVMQVGNGKYLLKEIYSWVNAGDVSPIGGTSQPSQPSGSIGAGSVVRIKQSATKYSTGETIPQDIKNRQHTVMQVGNGKYLLKEIYSWVNAGDLELIGGGTTQPSQPQPKPIGVGSVVRIKQSASTYSTGERIPQDIKNRTHTVMQIGNGKMLLKEIYSWVNTSDLVKA